MTSDARVVFGMPAYNRPDTLPRVFESLLSQTRRDFAIVIVDDSPSPEVRAIVDTYKALHPRITYEANPVRLGMIDNWRKAFYRSRELYPRFEYFAWVSDHDMWHPRWLEVLSRVLDEQPEVVMAYPLMQRVYPTRRLAVTRVFDTTGMTKRTQRLQRAIVRMTAGNCIYGLFRVRALERAGVFRAVLAPDRQLLVELSLLGQFRQVPEILWYREVAGTFSYKRQRRNFFPGHVPLYTFLPANVQHFGVLIWDLVVRGRGRPEFGRLAGLGCAFAHLWYSTKREITKDDARWQLLLRPTVLGESK
jgi:glycosyltransferase involved in cell wall biosynthesis